MQAASPWLNPTFLLVAGTSLVGLIAWFLRGEFRSNANATRQKDYEEAMDQRVDKLEQNQDKTKAAFYEHAGNTKVHHNEEAFNEFRRGVDQRFTTIDTKLTEIKSLITQNR